LLAFFLLKLERYQEAEEAYEELIADNPDCYDYYDGLLSASKINTSKYFTYIHQPI